MTKRYNTFKITGIKNLSQKIIDNRLQCQYKKSVCHAESWQEKDFSKAFIWDDVLEPITVNLMEYDSDSSNWNEDDDHDQYTDTHVFLLITTLMITLLLPKMFLRLMSKLTCLYIMTSRFIL
jgi:hypothetical protein